jgi:hypothetical protein
MPIKPDDNPLPIDELQRRTVPGMAYFAGTSVRRTFCDNCAFFTFEHTRTHRAGARCAKYFELTGRWHAAPLPPTTPACKYFKPASKANTDDPAD